MSQALMWLSFCLAMFAWWLGDKQTATLVMVAACFWGIVCLIDRGDE